MNKKGTSLLPWDSQYCCLKGIPRLYNVLDMLLNVVHFFCRNLYHTYQCISD